MSLFRKTKKEETVPTQWKITRDCLSFILESAKSVHPNEFAGLLRVDDISKDTIIELMLLPGTISGSSHAIFQLHMRPIDFSLVGTIHSHPSPSFYPSEADLTLFRKYGRIHIIVAHPYNVDSWQAYDGKGNKIEVRVI